MPYDMSMHPPLARLTRPHLDSIRAAHAPTTGVPASKEALTGRGRKVFGSVRLVASFVFVVLVVAGFLGVRSQALATAGHEQGGASSHAGHLVRQPAAVTNGLVAWYPLDGNAKDASGNGNDGKLANFTFDGTTDGWNGGKFGKALLFNGSSDYVKVPVSASLQSIAAAVTVSAWIYTSGPSSYPAPVLGTGGIQTSSNQGIMMGFDLSGGFSCTVQGDPNYGRVYFNPPLNQWANVGCSWSAASQTITGYVNGAVAASASYTGSMGPLSPLLIGSTNWSNAPFGHFNGSIDDARMYNRVLSASEMSQLYRGSQPSNCDQYCVGWWKLDETSRTTAKDSTSNGNSGTLTNFNFDGTTNGWTGGVFGNALMFNGTNTYVSIAGGGGLNNLTQGSISMWVKWSGTQTSDGYGIVGAVSVRQSAGNFTEDVIQLNGTNPATAKAVFHLDNANTVITGNTSVGDGVWRHVAVTFQPGSQKLYVDGRLDGSASDAAVTAHNYAAVPFTIGALYDGSAVSAYSKASVDDVRFYTRALTDYEVYDQYVAGRS